MNFDDFYWHDAVIKNIEINRNNPGVDDRIEIEIKWPDSEENELISFNEVYWADFNLNFGIVSQENVLQAKEIAGNDEDLIDFYAGWKGAMDEVKLKVYQIDLNSTGGKIKIISKGFTVSKTQH